MEQRARGCRKRVKGGEGAAGASREAPAAPWSRLAPIPTFPGSGLRPVQLEPSLPPSSQARRFRVSVSSEDLSRPEPPPSPPNSAAPWALLQEHWSGGESSASLGDSGCISQPLPSSNFCWSWRKGNVLPKRISQRRNIAAATSCCERILVLLGSNLISH